MDISFNKTINGGNKVTFNPLDALGDGGLVTYRSAKDINEVPFSLDSISTSVVNTIYQNGTIDSLLITNSTQEYRDSSFCGDGIANVNAGKIQNCILQNCIIKGNGVTRINYHGDNYYGDIINCIIQNCTIKGDGITSINGGCKIDEQLVNYP